MLWKPNILLPYFNNKFFLERRFIYITNSPFKRYKLYYYFSLLLQEIRHQVHSPLSNLYLMKGHSVRLAFDVHIYISIQV